MNNKPNTKYISKTRCYVDEEGNEGYETEIFKKVYAGTHFWKIWLSDLLQALDLISNSKQLDVVFHVLKNTDPSNNLYINTLQKTAEETGICYKTVAVIFKKMIEANMLAKKQNGVYFVRPELLMKGDDAKKQRLVIEYEKVRNERSEKNDN